MTALSNTQQAIEDYWQDKPFKSWVVKLESGRKSSFDSETKYVRAKTQSSAIRTAKQVCFLKGKIRCISIRLKGPSDIR
ncbi:MAG: hypothetical protein ACKE51_00060 [Methylococcaceae bacterium]